MKKNLISLIIAFVLCFSTSVLAQFSSEWEATGGLFATSVLSVATSGNNIYLGTDGEGVFCSTNNGESWTNSNVGLTNTTVRALTVDGTNVFAGTASGIFLSTNNGESWTATNNGLTNTNIYAIANNGSNIFAGTNGGGMFLSTNNGSDWVSINNGLNATLIRAISIYDNVLYVGTGYSSNSGVYVSSNNGSSWTQMNTGLTNINVTSLSASDGNLFAGTAGGGVFYSSNDGANWSQVNTGLTDNNINAVTINGANVYASTSETGIFKSTNNGQNWIGFNNGLLNSKMNCLYSKENIIIAGNSSGAFNTTNTEDAWTQFFTGTNPNLDVAKLAIKDNYIFAGTGNGSGEFFVSSNQGLNWNHIQTFYLPINNLVVSGNSVYFSPIDFIYQSTDNGQNWSVIGNFVLWHIHSFVVSGSNIYICYGQGGGFGIFKSTNNGADWTQLNTFQAQSFALNGDYVYAGGFNGSITISSDNGSSWIQSNLGTNSNVKQLLVVGNDLYAATDAGVFKSINNGIDWIQINTGLTNTVINSLAANSNYIFAGTGEGFFVSSNNGNNWELAGLDSCNIQTITLNDSTLYAGTFGNGIFKRALTQQQITLNPPVLLSPENNSSSIPTNPVLEWSSVENASSYTLQIATDADFENIIVDDTEITDTSNQATDLIMNTTYYWRVKAVNNEDESSWSEVWSFTTIWGANEAEAFFAAGPNLNTARYGHHSASLEDGRLVVFGGHGNNFVSLGTAEVWDPANPNSFTTLNMNYTHDMPTFVELNDGRYLIAGGCSNLGVPAYATSEIFNPVNNTFSPVGSMVRFRASGGGAELSNGNVLIASAWWTHNTAHTYGELLNQGTQTFSAVGPFSIARSLAIVMPTNDGQAVVLGGSTPTGANLPTNMPIELFNPENSSISTLQSSLFADEDGWHISTRTNYSKEQLMQDGRYLWMAGKSINSVGYRRLFTFDPETKTTAEFVTYPALPNSTIYSLSQPLVDYLRNIAHILAVVPGSDFPVCKVISVDLATGNLTISSNSYNFTYHYGTASVLSDGRIFITGGSSNGSNFNLVNNTTFITPPLYSNNNQYINLNAGWNTISANYLPDEPNLENIFAEMEELVIVKNADGQIFNPAQNINQIGDWNIAHGYMVYVTAPATLQITGTAVNPAETEINLVTGWNLVSYLRKSPLAINTAMAGISSSIILVKNNLGQLYYPAYGLNTLGNMQQGQGYWIYMSSPAALVYPGN